MNRPNLIFAYRFCRTSCTGIFGNNEPVIIHNEIYIFSKDIILVIRYKKQGNRIFCKIGLKKQRPKSFIP